MTTIGKQAHTTRWIPVKDISVVWQNAQRHFDERWAQEIAEKFDPDMFGIVAVCPDKKNGRFHAIDGQHRVAAVHSLWGGNEKVPCNIFEADTPERAAQIFDTMNTNRKSVQPLETFKVRVTGKVEPEFSVNKLITDLGFKVDSNKYEGNIGAVVSCVSVYKRHGRDLLLATLVRVRAIWGKQASAYDAPMIRGFAHFLAKHGRKIDHNRLTDVVAKQYSPGRLMGAAQSAREIYRGNLSNCISQVLVNTYNHGLRTGRIGE